MEFIYTLRLVDRLFIKENWTKEDESIASEHFAHLLKLEKENTLIIAGKTAGLGLDTKGIVIFKADNLEEARKIMNNDPAIKNKIMTGKLQEYNVAVFNKNYKK